MPHILIAEDSATQAVQIKMLLEEESHEVTTAENGSVALRKIAEGRPDLIVTDMEMPEMDGLDLVKAVRLQYPEIPVILMTAVGSDELAVEALEYGAAGYVPKSQLSEILLPTIDQVVGMLVADRSYAHLIECLDFNEFHFTFDNDPALIDPLVDLMQQMVVGLGLCDPMGRIRVGVALENALVNALFHGNLEISREQLEEERSALIGGGGESLVVQRRGQPEYADRRIHFEARMTKDQARFIVRDDGPGFDTSSLPSAADGQDLQAGDGRGLVLIHTFMDQVTFNDSGNEITMVKLRDADSNQQTD